MVFLVPHDYFCNSTYFGPKIIPKGQFKVPKKVKEFCSFATFNKKPNFFRESHVVLCDGQNNYFQVSKVVEGFMLYTYSFRKKVGFLCGAPQNNDFLRKEYVMSQKSFLKW